MGDAAAELDRRVEQFESAWAADAPPELHAFLPAGTDSHFLPTLAELIRVDLEFRRRRGEAARLERYQSAFPALFADAAAVRELAFEEYRLRLAAREPTHPREYAARYGIDTSDWPPPRSASSVPTQFVGDVEAAPPPYPKVGETVLDFRLVSELGRGAFARVYLAEQAGLAGRRVAVKVSARFGAAEPETLARLQHTHIVPVYSTHRSGPFQIVVMPFLGALTLADFLDDVRARGVRPGSGRVLADTLAAHRSKTVPASADRPEVPAGDAPARPAAADIAARTLARFTYPEAVLWIGAKLADALAHAHARGVLHRDVKPANVLLTDDAQPMLLDFNLAADAARPGARVGGTPVYMAPEQLRRMGGAAADVDGRADVFALGAVLYEALAGRHPFPPPAEKSGESVAELLRLRDTPPPGLATLNAAVSPSAAAIIGKCLEADPARRYASARELADDLERQLAHQPLVHVREPSPRERFRKWRRRHPRLASSGSVAALAAVLVLALGGAVYARHERVKQLERESADGQARRTAEETFRTFQQDARDAVPLLVVYGHDPRKLAEGERRVRDLLGRYAVLDDADWAEKPAAALLPEPDRAALRMQASEMLMVLARVGANRELDRPPGPDRAADVKGLRALVERAEAAHRSDAARQAYLDGAALVGRGKFLEAVRLLEDATARDPRQFWAWFNLGVAHLGLGADAAAEGCFHACVALEPDFPPGYFNRGLARLNRKQFAAADADFTTVLRLKPGTTDALVNRALARLALDRKADAEADVTSAIDLGAAETRLFFLRADVRERRGNTAGAAADRAAGLAATPADEASWVARGLARADTDAAGAIADFDAALKLNPRSFPALQNKAFVYSEKLNTPGDALAALDRAIDLYPDSLPSRAGRAVLLARKGDRAAAHRDAERCLGLNPGADIVYQVAGAYALTSATTPEDARVALRLLADALGRGYGFALLATDTDLDPIRGAKEFRALLDAAKAVQPAGGR